MAFVYLSDPLDYYGREPDHSSAYPMDPPSNATSDAKSLVMPAQAEAYETWFLRRYLQDNIALPHTPDPLFGCFCALMELQLSKSPLNIPLLTDSSKARDTVRSRYGRQRLESRAAWLNLRKDLDGHRMQAMHMARYVQQQFDVKQQPRLSDLLTRFDIYLRRLELAEAAFRDQIAIQSSAVSTKMAEQSIRESKRVTLGKTLILHVHILTLINLVTILAFIFLPVSVASSIYGMVSTSNSC